MGDNTNVSVIIIYSFAFLFLVFLFLQQGNIIPKEQATGYALSDTFSFNTLGNFSLTTLIIIAAALILVLVGGYFFYKKLRKKKELEAPNPPEAGKKISDLDKEFNAGNSASDSKNEEVINKLFMEESKQKKQEAREPEKKVQEKIQTKKEKPNFKELRDILKSLMKKNYTKESIVKYLLAKGYDMNQVKQALYSINQENLSNYIKNALLQGHNKQEITQELLKAGWSKEDILKRLS